MNKNKRKGTQAEVDVVAWLRESGFPRVERRALAGKNDRGDIAGIDGVVIEVKNRADMPLSEYMHELEIEMKNDNAWTGVVIHKRRGARIYNAYATMPAHVWLELLKRAL